MIAGIAVGGFQMRRVVLAAWSVAPADRAVPRDIRCLVIVQSAQPDVEFIEKCGDDADRRWSK
jgi:hypothetical protein